MFRAVSLQIFYILALTAALASSAAERRCVPGRYGIETLPLEPAAINDAGQVAGTTPEHQAAVWSKRDGLRKLELPGVTGHSEALGINRAGHVIGAISDQAFKQGRSFIVSKGGFSFLSGEKARAYRINDSDVVAGESLVSVGKPIEPVLWRDGSLQSLGACCGGAARGINNDGVAIGEYYDDQGRYHAFRWSKSTGLMSIGPADRYSSALAINGRGHIVVQAFPDAYLYVGGSLKRLELSEKFPSQPRAINDCDVVVGSFGPFSDAWRAFVWEESAGFVDLNTLIAADAGWKLEIAVSINERGEIVGRGDLKGEDDRGFLLTPQR